MVRWEGKPAEPQRWKLDISLKLPRSGEERRSQVVGVLAGKLSKEQANYRQAMDEAENKKSCAECQNFESPGQKNSSCIRVAGIIEADDICDLFIERQGPGAEPQPSKTGVSI